MVSVGPCIIKHNSDTERFETYTTHSISDTVDYIFTKPKKKGCFVSHWPKGEL